MTLDFDTVANSLASHGWTISKEDHKKAMPAAILDRYKWIPEDVSEFAGMANKVVRSDNKAWILTHADYASRKDSAFSWNQWEIDSLETAEGDSTWQDEIVEFWNCHFPILMSVKSGYAHFSLRKDDLSIVVGEEPEFEIVSLLYDSYTTLLMALANGDTCVTRWI